MAMHALSTNRKVSHLALIRDTSDEDGDAFMRTFDNAVTVGESYNWESWAGKHLVDQREVRDSDMLLITLVNISPFLISPFNRVQRMEAQQDVRDFLIDTDSEYTEFLFFLFRR